MKRFLLFAWEKYGQKGGMNDFVGDYDAIEKANKKVEESLNLAFDCYQILDSKNNTIIMPAHEQK